MRKSALWFTPTAVLPNVSWRLRLWWRRRQARKVVALAASKMINLTLHCVEKKNPTRKIMPWQDSLLRKNRIYLKRFGRKERNKRFHLWWGKRWNVIDLYPNVFEKFNCALLTNVPIRPTVYVYA